MAAENFLQQITSVFAFSVATDSDLIKTSAPIASLTFSPFIQYFAMVTFFIIKKQQIFAHCTIRPIALKSVAAVLLISFFANLSNFNNKNFFSALPKQTQHHQRSDANFQSPCSTIK